MAAERLARVLALLVAGGDTDPGVTRLCQVCTSVTHTSWSNDHTRFPRGATGVVVYR